LGATPHRTTHKVHERISPKFYATAPEYCSIAMSGVIAPYLKNIAQKLPEVIRSQCYSKRESETPLEGAEWESQVIVLSIKK